MIVIKFNSKQFEKDMSNIVKYSTGFLDGVKLAKKDLLSNIGAEIVRGIKEFIDANASVNPNALHHVYEWHRTASPEARLFDIQYVATNAGLSFNSSFRQSVSIRNGSKTPFYNKAEIMERGIPVTIRPVASEVLVFEENGEKVFTKKPVRVSDPGGEFVQGSYERVFNQFFDKYFRQSFLRSSGILDHLNNPEAFKRNLSKGKTGGRSAGISVGYKWTLRRVG